MKQDELMKLLKETVNAALNSNETIIIRNQMLLSEALGNVDSDKRKEGIEIVVETLYAQTIRYKPEHLLQLFPFFAMACCNDSNDYIIEKDIDWDLLKM